MSRKRPRRRVDFSDANVTPNRALPGRLDPLPSLYLPVRSPLTEVEDRRMWSPEPILEAPPRTLRRVSKLVPAKPVQKQGRHPKVSAFAVMNQRPVLAFSNPKFTAICIRRKQRREVLLALGKGGGGKKRPRRNSFSQVRC